MPVPGSLWGRLLIHRRLHVHVEDRAFLRVAAAPVPVPAGNANELAGRDSLFAPVVAVDVYALQHDEVDGVGVDMPASGVEVRREGDELAVRRVGIRVAEQLR